MASCIICCEDIREEDTVITCENCKNSYCVNCLKTWNSSQNMKRSINCPYCTISFSNTIYRMIYDVSIFGGYKLKTMSEEKVLENFINPVFSSFATFIRIVNDSEYMLSNGNYRYRQFNLRSLVQQLHNDKWTGDQVLVIDRSKIMNTYDEVKYVTQMMDSGMVPFVIPVTFSLHGIEELKRLTKFWFSRNNDYFTLILPIMGITNDENDKLAETTPQNRLMRLILYRGEIFEPMVNEAIDRYKPFKPSPKEVSYSIKNLGKCKNGICRGIVKFNNRTLRYECESCGKVYCEHCFQADCRNCKESDLEAYRLIKKMNYVCPICGEFRPVISNLGFYCSSPSCHTYFRVSRNVQRTEIKKIRTVSYLPISTPLVSVCGGVENFINEIEHLFPILTKIDVNRIIGRAGKWRDSILGDILELSVSILNCLKENTCFNNQFIHEIKPILLQNFDHMIFSSHGARTFNGKVVELIGKSEYGNSRFIFKYLKDHLSKSAKNLFINTYRLRLKYKSINPYSLFDPLNDLADGISELLTMGVSEEDIFKTDEISQITYQLDGIVKINDLVKSEFTNEKLRIFKTEDLKPVF